MKVLVATVNHILHVDLDTAIVSVLEEHRPEYYGISWWENSDALVLSHSGLANDSLVSVESYINSEKGFLSFDQKQTQNFLSQPHQILCAPNNIVIATNTGRNCITLYDAISGFHKDIRINDIFWDRLGKDNPCGEHFNSVYLKNNRMYILAHRFKKTSHILEFSFPAGELLERHEITHRSGLHNIWVDDAGNMFACHSESGQLIDVKSNQTLWSADSSYYSRGLAATQDVLIIGDSEITERESRKTSLSSIWIVDRKTMRTMEHLPLGKYGSVHEVRILDVADEAHHGKVFAGLEKLEQCLVRTNSSVAQIPAQTWKDNVTQTKMFKSILNGLSSVEDEWLTSKNAQLTLCVYEKQASQQFEGSFDYLFPEKSILTEQHLSFIFGFHGNDDSNMLAVLIHHTTGTHYASIGLWANKNNTWEFRDTLLTDISTKGKITVNYYNGKIQVTCNNKVAKTNKIKATECEGAIGVRCHGGYFKNFSLKNTQRESIKGKILKMLRAG